MFFRPPPAPLRGGLRPPALPLTLILATTLTQGCKLTGSDKGAGPVAAQAVNSASMLDPHSDETYAWLEEIESERALAWARAHNAASEGVLSQDPAFAPLAQKLFAIYSAKDKIPGVQQMGPWLYNFWVDAARPRGLWRRTTWSEYRKADPAWEPVLDVQALGEAEKESWVYGGAMALHPHYKKCLISLSRGGGDADVVREFDLTTKAFVPGGFVVPEAKTSVSWKDEDTIYVGTDFGAGSLTTSGYPRVIKEWRRGTPLSEAREVFSVSASDVSASGGRVFDHDRVYDLFTRRIDFERSKSFLLRDGRLREIPKPDDADFGLWDGHALLRPRSPLSQGGHTYPAGALLIADLEALLEGRHAFQALFTPTANASLDDWTGTKTHIIVTTLVDVKTAVTVFSKGPAGTFEGRTLKADVPGSLSVSPVAPHDSDEAWLGHSDFLTPSSLSLWPVSQDEREVLKRLPARFDATGLVATQHFATSRDGTKVPYFQVAKAKAEGPAPTLISAYGGFEISRLPGYNATVGAAWLERGGVFVLANLRGGGEYGPAWHEAAMREKRQNAYDDMIAVAEDLVARKVTTSKQLGITGGSNGGLLTSVMLTQRPDLFGAVVSAVPLADMRRFHKLLAGASWMSEYGNPDDPADWAFLSRYSPFHNLRPAGAVTYPPVLYTTSTRDDRVHPAHARKMVARLEALGHAPLYFENIEGGHGGAADIRQAAHVMALEYVFLARTLGL
ncbi:MAG: prolyl oligopeptidase family serine peptidase [Myxococcales bacterium]|nr:prolyl oligopeptidase family serine peptidase [Myxococcales bacterium]